MESSILLASDVLQRNISEYPHFKAQEPSNNPKIIEAINDIFTGKYKRQIEPLRIAYKNGDFEAYKDGKSKLPAFTWQGTFTRHRKEDLIQPTGILHFEFDHLGENLSALRQRITSDIHTLFCFISPSGDGLKVAFWTDYIKDDATYKTAFQAVENYLKLNNYNFEPDKATKDISRLCFVSYDNFPYISKNASPFDVEKWKPEEVKPIPHEVKTQQKQATTTKTAQSKREHWKEQAVRNCIDILESASKGNRHDARLKTGHLAGGFVSGGMLQEYEILPLLLNTSDRISENPTAASEEAKTIQDAFEHGKRSPITFEMKQAEFESYLYTHGKRYSAKRTFTHVNDSNDADGISDAINQFDYDEESQSFINSATGETLTDDDLKYYALRVERGDGELFSQLNTDFLLFDHTSETWLFYADGVWKPDETKQQRLTIAQQLQSFYVPIAAIKGIESHRLSKEAIDETNEQNKVTDNLSKEALETLINSNDSFTTN